MFQSARELLGILKVFIFEILDQLLRLALQLLGLDVNDGPLLVVQFTVSPNLRNVVEHIVIGFVLIPFKVVQQSLEIHRLLDNKRIVDQTHCLPGHWFLEHE